MAKHFNIDKLNKQQECFNEHELQSYVNNKADKDLRFAIENHLLDCEVCSDVVEGLQLIKNEANAESYLKSVKQGVKSITTNSGANNSKFVWWSVAAIFIVGLGSFWFFSQQSTQLKQNNLAQRIEEKEPTPPSTQEEIAETKISSNDISPIAKKEAPKKAIETTSIQNNSPAEGYALAEDEALAPTENEKESTESFARAEQKDKSIDANLTYSVPQLATTTGSGKTAKGEVMLDDIEPDAKKDIAKSEESAKAKKESTRKKSTETRSASAPASVSQGAVAGVTSENPLLEAKKLYDKKQYADAANLYTQIYYSKSSLEASYYAANSYFKIKNYEAAHDFCNVNIRAKKEFYEEAQWLQYEVYTAQSKTDKAKEILQEISKQNGKFAKQANAELQKLK
ncbi:MAG: hypothetical protein V4667_02595 [Bacteroidota bacterium]